MKRAILLSVVLLSPLAFASDISAGAGVASQGTTSDTSRNSLRVVVDGVPSTHTRNLGVGARTTTGTGREDVWQGPTTTRPLPSAAGVSVEILSSSANDAAAGTGVQTVHVVWLNTAGTQTITTITTNGVTPVAMAGTVWRVNAFHAATVGSGGLAAGNISVRDATDHTTVYEYISAGQNAALTAMRTVPAGQYWYVSDIHCSAASSKDALFRLRATADPESLTLNAGVFVSFDAIYMLNASTQNFFNVPIRFPPLTDVKMDVQSATASGASVTAMIDGWLDTQ